MLCPERGVRVRIPPRAPTTRLKIEAFRPFRDGYTECIPAHEESHMSEPERLSAEDLAAESATALPRKEVMSLLDLNADVDLALDLAAPVDLAVAANLNVAAPI